MKLRALLEGVPVLDAAADLDMEITGVSYDSRTTRPGDLFVAEALAGDQWVRVKPTDEPRI